LRVHRVLSSPESGILVLLKCERKMHQGEQKADSVRQSVSRWCEDPQCNLAKEMSVFSALSSIMLGCMCTLTHIQVHCVSFCSERLERNLFFIFGAFALQSHPISPCISSNLDNEETDPILQKTPTPS